MKAAVGLLICFCVAYFTVCEANYGCPIKIACKIHCLTKRCFGKCGGGGWIKKKCICFWCRKSNQDQVIGDFPSNEVTKEFPSDEFNEEFPSDKFY
ncbi:Hypothetical predicted protein [Mytilus galloprovincialis]|uniref:Uncharacterized protein n=1 Tax=Mytilus galloprovincialis TaxID=29158 RepID=A0A8B6CUT9_MYTGA|nr:Hypothetical predicted protein [Mytilus galloprovincialis]